MKKASSIEPVTANDLMEPPSRSSLLLVDDDRLILATLGAGLRNAGYEVTEASSGEAALDRAGQTMFDLAVLDIRLGDISGIELARRLRETHGVATLFLSAYSDREMVDAAIAEGGVGYVVKPVDVTQLVPAIGAALARARDLRALLDAKGQLEQALAGERSVSEAIGILMEREGLIRQAAFEALRAHARAQGRRLDEVAMALVNAEETLNALKNRGRMAPG